MWQKSASLLACWAGSSLLQSQLVGQRQEGPAERVLLRGSPTELPQLPAVLLRQDMCEEIEEWWAAIPSKHCIYDAGRVYESLTPSSAPNKFETSSGYFVCKWKTVFILPMQLLCQLVDMGEQAISSFVTLTPKLFFGCISSLISIKLKSHKTEARW